MSARVLRFPKRSRSTIRVVCDDGEWIVTDGEQGWPCGNQAHAIEEALKWARECYAPVIVIETR